MGKRPPGARKDTDADADARTGSGGSWTGNLVTTRNWVRARIRVYWPCLALLTALNALTPFCCYCVTSNTFG